MVSKIINENSQAFEQNIKNASVFNDKDFIYKLDNYIKLIEQTKRGSALYDLFTGAGVSSALIAQFKRFDAFHEQSGFYTSRFDQLSNHDKRFKPLKGWLLGQGLFLIKPCCGKTYNKNGQEEKFLFGTAKKNVTSLSYGIAIQPKPNFRRELEKHSRYKITLSSTLKVIHRYNINSDAGWGLASLLGSAINLVPEFSYNEKEVTINVNRSNNYRGRKTVSMGGGTDSQVWVFSRNSTLPKDALSIEIIDVEPY